MVVGDAAAQAKPTSGGGLYTGICAAKIAGEVAAAASEGDGLGTYETRWRQMLDRELSLGMALRRLFKNLHNREINFIFEVLDNKSLLDIVAKHGDIDYPSLIIKALLQHPKEWWRVFKGLGAKLTSSEIH